MEGLGIGGMSSVGQIKRREGGAFWTAEGMVGGKALKVREWKPRAGRGNRRWTELSWAHGGPTPPPHSLHACWGPENTVNVSDSQFSCTLESLGHLFKYLKPRPTPDHHL